jgi:hypothetical protein
MLYALCFMLYALCFMLYALCFMLYALCFMLYSQCSMVYALFCFVCLCSPANARARPCTPAHTRARPHTPAHTRARPRKHRGSTRKHAEACGSIKVFKCLVRPFHIFGSQYKSLLHFLRGGEGGCKSYSMDSLLLSKKLREHFTHIKAARRTLVKLTPDLLRSMQMVAIMK